MTRAAQVGYSWRFAVPLLAAPALNPLNTTMIAIALVPIAEATGVSAATALWLVAGLYLVSSVGQPTWGRLADLFGPRRVFLAGLVFAALGGIVPAITPTFTGVLVARLLIGLGTSASYPSAMTMIADQEARLGAKPPQVLLSGMSMASLVSISVGPVLGGLLVHLFGWQSIFLVNVPVAVAIGVLALLFLPSDATRPDSVRHARDVPLHRALDVTGIVLFAATVLTALIFLLDIERGWWWLVPVSLASGTALVLWERRAARPFVDVRMLARNGALSRTYLRFFLSYTAIYLVVYSVTPWLQSARGYAADVTGYMMLPLVAVAFTANLSVARSPRVRPALMVAAIVPIVAGALLWLVDAQTPLWVVLLVVAMFGVPQGLVAVSNQVVLYAQAPAGQVGVAAGLSRTSLQLGAIAASAIIALAVGDAPSDAGLHSLGLAVAIVSALVLALVVADRSLGQAGVRRAHARPGKVPA